MSVYVCVCVCVCARVCMKKNSWRSQNVIHTFTNLSLCLCVCMCFFLSQCLFVRISEAQNEPCSPETGHFKREILFITSTM